jgi:hypothetical protein
MMKLSIVVATLLVATANGSQYGGNYPQYPPPPQQQQQQDPYGQSNQQQQQQPQGQGQRPQQPPYQQVPNSCNLTDPLFH